MSRPTNETIYASIETVENKCLLAGVVGMEITNGGDLILTGDAANNEIEIGLTAEDEGYVLGLNGTEVEFDGLVLDGHTFPVGLVQLDIDLPGLEGDLQINMGNGDDSVTFVANDIDGTIHSLSVSGDMSVNLGRGSDSLQYDGGQFHSGVVGETDIRGGGGSGADYIDISQFVSTAGLSVRTGASGNGLDQVLVENSYLLGETQLKGGSGETEIAVQECFLGDLLIKGGSGDDQLFVASSVVVKDVHVDTGSSSNGLPGDYVGVGSTTIGGDLRIDGRQGTTTVQFQPTQMGSQVTVVGSTMINTRGGDDSLLIDDLEPAEFMGDVMIKTGGGSDHVEFEEDTTFGGDLTVNLGGGNDTVEFANNSISVQGNGVLNGGGGEDTAINHPFAIWFSGDPLLISIENLIA